jgi:hypothetical protein
MIDRAKVAKGTCDTVRERRAATKLKAVTVE